MHEGPMSITAITYALRNDVEKIMEKVRVLGLMDRRL
jgi:hypothetical protein